MFGYVRPFRPELRVREEELYRSVYCGLCRTMRKRISFFSAFSLNYDFVFLCFLRAALIGETFQFCSKRCALHPLKRRSCANDSEAILFVAKMHLALSYEKLRDDLRDPDTPFWKKTLFFCYRPFLRRPVKRLMRNDKEFAELYPLVQGAVDKLYELERQKITDLDLLSHTSGDAVAKACCVGLSGNAARLMQATAACCGRLVYLLDACDDLKKDAKTGSFNPILCRYQTLDAAREHLKELDLILSLYAKEFADDVALFSQNAVYRAICENIVQLGIPSAIRRVMRENKAQSSAAER